MDLSRREFVRMGSLASLMYAFPLKSVLASEKETLQAIDLYSIFQNPPNAARPFVRWWWNGLRVEQAELLRELDMLKEKGISGVEINSIAFPSGNEAMSYKPIEWLSDEWLRLLKTTVEGAKERDITCDIIVGSGWPFGGEFLRKDEQIQLLSLGTKELAGGQQHQLEKSELLADMEVLRTYKKGSIELFGLRLVPEHLDVFQPGVDLNAKINDETIAIDVPPGKHVLHYMVKLTGYTAVTHGAPGAAGPVLDHYNKAAVQKYLNRMSDAITAKVGRMGDYFRSVFIDSLELRGSNWCDDIQQQFKQRRGYALEPYLPFILFKINPKSTYNGGQLLGENSVNLSPAVQDEIERVRYDFEITRLELFHERFLKTFVDWCRENGVKSRVQAYGREYYPLKSAMVLDIPECETWLRPDVGTDLEERTFKTGRAYRPVNKFVASAARLSGKNIVSCEEITNTTIVFNASLERIKITGDQSNLSGVTHSILHGFNYSPKDIPFPGWVRYGTLYNERNPWWPYLRTWIDYKARLSAVFQAAEPQADVAVLFPMADMWSKVGLQYQQYPQIVYPEYANNIWEAVHQNGGGCDYIDEDVLKQSKFSGGKLHYGSRSYSVLIMPEVESIAPDTASALRKFAAAGGKLLFIGKAPVKSPGMADHVAKDSQVHTAIGALRKAYPNNAILCPEPAGNMIDWYAGLQSTLKLPAFVTFDKRVTHVNQVHYKTSQADVFFISNYHLEKSHQFTATFNNQGRTAWLWNPETGERHLYPTAGAKNKLLISLDPAESILIVFTDETKGQLYPVKKAANPSPQSIVGPWQVTLEKVYEKPREMVMDRLIDFKDDQELQSFGGVVHYEKRFNAANPTDYHYLDLGKVGGISEVTLNGKSLGFKWYGKHLYDLSGALKSGDNMLQIKVSTVLGNYAKSLKDNVVAQNWTKKQPLYSAGLIGPVKIV